MFGEAFSLPEHRAAPAAFVRFGKPTADSNLRESIRAADGALERNQKICHTVRIYIRIRARRHGSLATDQVHHRSVFLLRKSFARRSLRLQSARRQIVGT